MKLTAVAQSYMNHASPQSSKSITIVRSPSTSRFARRRSAWMRPKRSGPEPKRSSRSRIVRSSRVRIARSSGVIPSPSCQRPQWPFGAERGRVVPREARERRRPRPAARVLVHARGDAAEAPERRHVLGRRRRTVDPLEQDDVARDREAVERHRLHPRTRSRARDGRRLDDALCAQRLEPGQLGLDLAGVVVAGPVHTERRPATGHRIVDPVRPVLRDVDQRRGCRRREVVVLERGSCEPVELILRRLVACHTFSRSSSSVVASLDGAEHASDLVSRPLDAIGRATHVDAARGADHRDVDEGDVRERRARPRSRPPRRTARASSRTRAASRPAAPSTPRAGG